MNLAVVKDWVDWLFDRPIPPPVVPATSELVIFQQVVPSNGTNGQSHSSVVLATAPVPSWQNNLLAAEILLRNMDFDFFEGRGDEANLPCDCGEACVYNLAARCLVFVGVIGKDRDKDDAALGKACRPHTRAAADLTREGGKLRGKGIHFGFAPMTPGNVLELTKLFDRVCKKPWRSLLVLKESEKKRALAATTSAERQKAWCRYQIVNYWFWRNL